MLLNYNNFEKYFSNKFMEDVNKLTVDYSVNNNNEVTDDNSKYWRSVLGYTTPNNRPYQYIDEQNNCSTAITINKYLTKYEQNNDDVYEICINPDVSKKINRIRICDYDDDKDLMKEIKKKILNSKIWKQKVDGKRIQFFLFPEYAPVTLKLHFHGIITGATPYVIKKIRSWCNREISRGKGTTIYDMNKKRLAKRNDSRHKRMLYITKDYGKCGLKIKSINYYC